MEIVIYTCAQNGVIRGSGMEDTYKILKAAMRDAAKCSDTMESIWYKGTIVSVYGSLTETTISAFLSDVAESTLDLNPLNC